MGFFDSNDYSDSYNQYSDHPEPHKAELSHELLAGAGTFEAMKLYNDHCAKNGQPPSHALAKELFAGFAGAAIDRVVETKGADAWSAHQRSRAQEQVQQNITENFTENDYTNYDSNSYSNNY